MTFLDFEQATLERSALLKIQMGFTQRTRLCTREKLQIQKEKKMHRA